jgi:hypothetical protein
VSELLEDLAGQQADTGQVGEENTFDLETTALAAQAWLTEPAFADSAERAISWLQTRRDESGGFGKPLATSATLQALAVQAENSRRDVHAGKVVVRSGAAVLAEREIEADRRQAIVVDGFDAHLAVGQNSLVLEVTAGNQLPYTAAVRYHRREQPAQPDGCFLNLQTDLDNPKTVEAGTVRIGVRLKNTSEQIAASPVVHVGLPAGLEVAASLLGAEKRAGRLSAYETQPRRLILFARALEPGQEVQWAFEASATVPGHYLGPASFAYLQQSPEARCWAEPLSVEIAAEK